jgi:hypothetical protein
MRSASLVGFLAVFLLAGCDSRSPHEAIADDMVGKMRQMVDVMKGVKDEDSAKSAKPRVQALAKELDELKAKSDKLGKPSPETEKRLKEKHEKEVEQLTGDLLKEMMRVGMDPKLAPHMQDVMSKS